MSDAPTHEASAGGEVGVEGGAVSAVLFRKGDEQAFRALVEYEGFFITARLDGNGLRASVHAQARYGSRSVSAIVPLPAGDLADIERELREAAENVADAARQAAEEAAMQSYMAAKSRREV